MSRKSVRLGTLHALILASRRLNRTDPFARYLLLFFKERKDRVVELLSRIHRNFIAQDSPLLGYSFFSSSSSSSSSNLSNVVAIESKEFYSKKIRCAIPSLLYMLYMYIKNDSRESVAR